MGVATERLYYRDSYLISFRGSIVDKSADGRRVYLDRTAFYPASGGQPHDVGSIGGAPVVDVIDEDERILHVLSDAVVETAEIECSIDWARRSDHMQQHTGQHLLSAVLLEMFGAQTVGFRLGAEASTIDLSVPALEPAQVAAAEARANSLVFENRAVSLDFTDSPADLRKPSQREGTLRIVSIAGLDRSACGGTHVRATGEIGPILIRKLDRIRGALRVEFLCGNRAVRRARSDYDALSRIARTLSSGIDEAPGIVAAQADALAESEKARRKMAAELAQIRGRELYAGAAAGADGSRRYEHRAGKLDDEVRALAQGFTSGPRSVFLAYSEEPPAVLLAASADAGLHAGNAVKTVVSANGGRGGGSAAIGQGSVPGGEKLRAVLDALRGLSGNNA